MRPLTLRGAALALSLAGPGGVLAAQQSPLDGYVERGLRANLELQSERYSLRQAGEAVREADGRWLPSVTLTARYSERSGNILDLGSLVNPAFGALNQLLGRNAFPTDVRLKQPYRQETAVRLTQPVFEARLLAGSAIARDVRRGRAAQVRGDARALAARIRLVYLDYGRAVRLQELRRAVLEVLRENRRVAQVLVDHGSGTPDAVLRAQADLSEGEQQLAEAVSLTETAREALNVLLDRAPDAAIDLPPDSLLGIRLTLPLDSALAFGARGRDEFRALDAGTDVARGQLRLARASFLPSLVAAVDYGFQGDRYRFRGDQDYLVASLVLSWNLFNGGQDRARMAAARLRVTELETQRAAVERQVALEIRTAWRAARVAQLAVVTATDRLASAERSYALVERKYREGAAAQVALIDARTSYTAARLNLILTTYDAFARAVDLDRAAAVYPAPALLEEFE